MRKGTVKFGLKLIIAGIVALILATFYHEDIARLLSLPPAREATFVYLGFFWGGVCGCLGILVTVTGLVRSAGRGPDLRLAPTVILLAAAIILYFSLLYSSFTQPEPPKVRPGETITI
jgi:hypothetical protein